MSVPQADPDKARGLEAAKEKLMGEAGMSLDVHKILAENRIREDRKARSRKDAAVKLEKELAAARERGSQMRIRELEAKRLKAAQEQSREVEAVRQALDDERAKLKKLENDRERQKPAIEIP
ncbi:MAG: hypothetical protein RLZZ416_743 [Candidatus Parcubacteria bacterium]|jgi:hypothetical protein